MEQYEILFRSKAAVVHDRRRLYPSLNGVASSRDRMARMPYITHKLN
jgi:hypothetical protein